MINYLTCAFSKPTLTTLIKEPFGSDFPEIFHKQQIQYLFQYLSDLEAKSILLEREYIDKDYLEDYVSYYVKCFGNNGEKCARLHFFKTDHIDHKFIEEILTTGT
jgi:hypothetical protein